MIEYLHVLAEQYPVMAFAIGGVLVGLGISILINH